MAISQGGLAVVGINTEGDDSDGNIDTVALYATENIAAGEVFYISEDDLIANGNSSFSTDGNANIIRFTVPSGGISAGTVITINTTDAAIVADTRIDEYGSFGLGSDEGLMVFQGTTTTAPNSGSAASVTFTGVTPITAFTTDAASDPVNAFDAAANFSNPADALSATFKVELNNATLQSDTGSNFGDDYAKFNPGSGVPYADKAAFFTAMKTTTDWDSLEDAKPADGITGFGTYQNFGFGSMPCFCIGKLIETMRGSIAVEDLEVGDEVLTLHDDVQPIRWIGKRTLTKLELEDNPELNPVLIKEGALGDAMPTQDLWVSPQHGILLDGPMNELMFDISEVLARALHLVNGDTIQQVSVEEVTYYHFLFDTHQIVISNGAASESLFLGEVARSGFAKEALNEIYALFPELKTEDGIGLHTVRPVLREHEARVLMHA